jgi:hypothetical protein
MTLTFEKIAVGTKLFLGKNMHGYGCWDVTVTKIGRKWVTLSDGSRFDPSVQPWRTDGGDYSQHSHPVWICREDAADDARLDRAIEALHRLMDWLYGPSLRSKVTTVDQVRRACEALNMLPEFDAMMEKPK